MDSMEANLRMIGLGEVGYFIMVGAQSAGASPSEAFDVMVAFYVAGLLTNSGDNTDEETPSS